MNTTTKLLAILLLAATVGCAHHKKGLFASKRTNKNPGDTSFAAGAGRAPTATTSYSFAKILIAQGRDRDALYVLGHILRDHPTYIPAYNETAGIYVRSDRLSDALSYLNAGLKHSPNDAVLHNNIGMCHFLDDRNAEALAAFTTAVEASPTNPTYRANRAAALAMLGLTEQAEADYRTVLSRHDTRANLLALAKARQKADTDPSADATEPAPAATAAPQQPAVENEKAQIPEASVPEPSTEEKTETPPVSLNAPTLDDVAYDDTEEGDQEIATQ